MSWFIYDEPIFVDDCTKCPERVDDGYGNISCPYNVVLDFQPDKEEGFYPVPNMCPFVGV